jgi:NADH-quinone oxidoreductase subunit J
MMPSVAMSPANLPTLLAQAGTPLVSPTLILILCVFAGVATVFLLPGHREVTVRKVAGVTLAILGLILFAILPSSLGGDMGGGGSGGEAFYFWVFAAIAVGSALRVVTHSRPVYSALYFVLTVFASAGLFVLMQAEFMAAALVLIYAGAILVTYVFVIMLASQATGEGDTARQMAWYDANSREPAAAAAIGFVLMGVLLYVIYDRAEGLAEPYKTVDTASALHATGATEELGVYLFTHQSVQLEMAGIILLVSMVGAIVITKRQVLTLVSTHPQKLKHEVVEGPNTPVDDNPHSIPVDGTESRRQKVYPGA